MLDAGIFSTLDKISILPMADNELCYAMHCDTDKFVAAQKKYINLLGTCHTCGVRPHTCIAPDVCNRGGERAETSCRDSCRR